MPIRRELRKFYTTPEWKAARAEVRERAGDRCEQCGAKNGATGWRMATGRFVDIGVCSVERPANTRLIFIQCGCAHLNNVAGDDRPENLAWLCRGCHLHHDQDFHRLTRSIRKDAARPLLTQEFRL